MGALNRRYRGGRWFVNTPEACLNRAEALADAVLAWALQQGAAIDRRRVVSLSLLLADATAEATAAFRGDYQGDAE